MIEENNLFQSINYEICFQKLNDNINGFMIKKLRKTPEQKHNLYLSLNYKYEVKNNEKINNSILNNFFTYLKKWTNAHNAWSEIAEESLKIGKNKDALLNFNRAIELDPFDYYIWEKRGNPFIKCKGQVNLFFIYSFLKYDRISDIN